jgi:hypothetical protein
MHTGGTASTNDATLKPFVELLATGYADGQS